MLNRRLFIAGAATTALTAPAILRGQSIFREFPFSLGVAAGDPSADGFVIWTKIAPEPLAVHGGIGMAPLPVQWEVASDDRFATIVQKGEAIARPELGHAVHVELAGLEANRPYFYRFSVGGERSLRGTAKTLPALGSNPTALKFGVAGCQNYEDGYFSAFRHLAAEDDLAFVYHYGDFIYEYRQNYEFDKHGLPAPAVRKHAFRELYDIADYRRCYGQYLSDIDLQAARGAHTWLSSFDDHEIHDNWVQNIDQDPVPPEVFALRRQGALQAWYEHMPVRRALLPRNGQIGLNRRVRYGDLAALDLLDTRQFRSDQPCGDGFKPTCPEVSATNAQVLGAEQETWLNANLARKETRWNCLAQQVTMMALDRRRRTDEPAKILNLDSWAGYDVPRQRLLSRARGLDNLIVLTGDEHQNFCGELTDRDRVVGAEFVSTSITAGGDGQDLRPGSDVFLANNPQLKFVNDQRGYLTCEVTREAWRTNFMVVDKVSSPTSALSKRATGEVAFAQPGLRMT